METKKKIRRNVILGLAALCICSANSIKVFSAHSVRNVDALILVGLGMALSACIYNIAFYIKFKNKKVVAG